ncbi:MAG: DoxX family protein [Planctomycetota bacterium]
MSRNTLIGRITSTDSSKATIVPRALAAVPLIGINIQHLTGAAPLRPILEGANIPMPGVNAVLGPVFGVIAGLLLISGAFARVGSAIAVGSMGMAIYAHAVHDWADEPPIVLPVVVLLAGAWVLWKGAGAWSVDGRSVGTLPAGQPA